MNMVEKVARVMCKFEFEHGYIGRDWQGTHAELDYMLMARAAIEAIYTEIKSDKPHDITDIHYMFDAALKG